MLSRLPERTNHHTVALADTSILSRSDQNDDPISLTLLLLRHAKSSWDDPSLDDFDRPLAKVGRSAALKLGDFLAQSDFEPPQVIFASPSVRTRQTLDLVRQGGWAASVPVIFDERLFNFDIVEADPTSYMYFVKALNSSHRRVLIVGHNPPIGALAYNLVASKQQRKTVSSFSPATFCEIKWTKLNGWELLEYGKGRLGIVLKPRDFPW